MKMFSIKDTKMNYDTPFFMPNNAVAIRALESAVNGDQRGKLEFAEDKELWEVGEWNPESGEIKGQLTFITKAIDLQKKVL